MAKLKTHELDEFKEFDCTRCGSHFRKLKNKVGEVIQCPACMKNIELIKKEKPKEEKKKEKSEKVKEE